MQDSTLTHQLPSERTLRFIRAFARIYSPTRSNEAEARSLARSLAYGTIASC